MPAAKIKQNTLRDMLILSAVLVAVAALCRLATFNHAPQPSAWPTCVALAAVWLSCLPGLSFHLVFSNGAARQLGAITWRLLTMLLALGMAGTWEMPARNYYLTTLLACYFVSLPLESWLLIRQCKSVESSSAPSP
jgi:hypothetical protein